MGWNHGRPGLNVFEFLKHRPIFGYFGLVDDGDCFVKKLLGDRSTLCVVCCCRTSNGLLSHTWIWWLTIMRIWHISGNRKQGYYSRAFANPKNICQKIAMYLRGWRPFNAHWWSKPSHQYVIAYKESLRQL